MSSSTIFSNEKNHLFRKSIGILEEISLFLKYKWTDKELRMLNDDILKFISTLREGIITYPNFSKKSKIQFALIAKKQVKIFFEESEDIIEIYLFWPNKKNTKLLLELLKRS